MKIVDIIYVSLADLILLEEHKVFFYGCSEALQADAGGAADISILGGLPLKSCYPLVGVI